MASLTIYLDKDTLKSVETAAKRCGKSVSDWAKEHLAEASRTKKGWPDGYFETIADFGGTEIEDPSEVAVPLDDILLDLIEL
ncbi:MAG: ribbon-helix-helix protein, CopG family [Verrucomicrobiae bacterium]|nr:ribbon-helix-helix protein, CopG family [Verrucomicrobiae bacterium]